MDTCQLISEMIKQNTRGEFDDLTILMTSNYESLTEILFFKIYK